MKNHIKAGLAFGVAMTVCFTLTRLFQASEFSARNIGGAVFSGLIGGAVGGLLFGFFIKKFAKSAAVQISFPLHENESLVFESNANHFKGIEAVGGKLILTNQRLVFASHKLNIQNHEWYLPVSEIKAATRSRTLGVINNGLHIETRHGAKEKFVVDKAEEWIRLLTPFLRK